MRLTGFVVHGPSGEPAAQFEPGEVAHLSLEAECYEPRLVPSVGFQFRDRFGNLVCGTNTWMLSMPMAPLEAGATLRTTFAIQLTLGAGEYTISIALSSPDDRPERIYDWVDQVGSFTVTRSTRQWTEGLVYCPVSVWSTAAFDQEGLPADV
jgi:lipopolysaccharide transport system ATP-binding protein